MSDAKGAKQDPAEKARRVKAADGRVYFSYAQIHAAVSSMVPKVSSVIPPIFRNNRSNEHAQTYTHIKNAIRNPPRWREGATDGFHTNFAC
uniref:Uncharacterized protein n=1 Tax=Lotharella globosa TaxID=91324 RepID=A0A7S3YFC3_9EUKA